MIGRHTHTHSLSLSLSLHSIVRTKVFCMIQGTVECLGCKTSEVHSNAALSDEHRLKPGGLVSVWLGMRVRAYGQVGMCGWGLSPLFM